MAWFKLNQTEFTNLFCVNKNNVNSECKAKCYLKAKLELAEKQSAQTDKSGGSRKQVTEETLIHYETSKFFFNRFTTFAILGSYVNHYHSFVEGTIFHPPNR